MRPLIVVDTETTGLDWDTHELWEVAAIEVEPGGHRSEYLWRVEPLLRGASHESMEMNGYWQHTERMCHAPAPGIYDLTRTGDPDTGYWSDPWWLAGHLALALSQATIVGAVPGFDTNFMRRFLAGHGVEKTTWHYRIRDIGSMAHGYLRACRAATDLAVAVPTIDANTDDFALALGLDPASYGRHTGLGDARLVADMLDIISGRQPVTATAARP